MPILHLNGYKISAPTIYARKSERELSEMIRGFGYEPIIIDGEDVEEFQSALEKTDSIRYPFIIMKTEKGATGPLSLNGQKIAGNYLSHQVPLKFAKSDPQELAMLEEWLLSYRFNELYDEKKGFIL